MIVVDDREPLSYQKAANFVARMPRGDYCVFSSDSEARDFSEFSGEIGKDAGDPAWPEGWRASFAPFLLYERKTVSDFWTSLKSNRLNLQMVGLDGLLLEFTYIPRRIDWEGMYNAMNGIAHEAPVFHIRNLLHMWRTLRRWERQLKDGTYDQVKLKANVIDLTNPQLTLLAQLPGIGEKRAADLLRYYGNVGNVLGVRSEAVEQWTAVEGVGPKTIDAVQTFFSAHVQLPEADKKVIQRTLKSAK